MNGIYYIGVYWGYIRVILGFERLGAITLLQQSAVEVNDRAHMVQALYWGADPRIATSHPKDSSRGHTSVANSKPLKTPDP